MTGLAATEPFVDRPLAARNVSHMVAAVALGTVLTGLEVNAKVTARP